MPVIESTRDKHHSTRKRKRKKKGGKKRRTRRARRRKAQKRKQKLKYMGIIIFFSVLLYNTRERKHYNPYTARDNIESGDSNIVDENIEFSSSNTAKENIQPELNPDYIDETSWLTDENKTFPNEIIQEAEKIVSKKEIEKWKNWVVLNLEDHLAESLVEFLNKEGIQLTSNRTEKTYIYMVAYEKLIKHHTKYSPLAMAYILTQLFIVLTTKKESKVPKLIKGNSVDNLLGEAILHHEKSHTKDEELLQIQKKGKANLIPSMHVIIYHGKFKEAFPEEAKSEQKYNFKMEEVKLDSSRFGHDSVHKLAESKGVKIDEIASDELVGG